MTVTQRILSVMSASPKSAFTDGELGLYTDAPEPSIRRARLQLERRELIEYVEDFAGRSTWRITPHGIRTVDNDPEIE